MDAFRVLPGVGPKTAQRMAMHLLERERPGGQRLAAVIQQAIEEVGYCQRCRTLTEEPLCGLCQSARRDDSLLCVVESPADMLAIEEAGGFQGRYFVLHGHLSPLDGIGPEDIGLDQLETLMEEGLIEEVVLATNPTVGAAELEVARTELDRLETGLHTPRVRLDGLRLILVTSGNGFRRLTGALHDRTPRLHQGRHSTCFAGARGHLRRRCRTRRHGHRPRHAEHAVRREHDDVQKVGVIIDAVPEWRRQHVPEEVVDEEQENNAGQAHACRAPRGFEREQKQSGSEEELRGGERFKQTDPVGNRPGIHVEENTAGQAQNA